MNKATLNFFVVMLSLILTSCWSDRSGQIKKMTGIYMFTYPSQEVEVLTINEDSTYRKDIYLTQYEFQQKSSPKYTNEGTWSIVEDNQIVFDNWLMYNKNCWPDTILPKPIAMTLLNNYWEPPTFNKNAAIVVFDQSGYVFEKIN